jgi:peptide/nickel transport system substrate-binding protein
MEAACLPGCALKGANVRGNLSKFVLPLTAVAVLVAAGTAGGAASKGGTLVFAGAADPTYLDPALVSDGESFRVTEQIFEGLIALKPGTTKIEPKLAIGWSLAPDGKTWTFNLRRGVKFHDGTPFNAKAVCANFNRWYNWTGAFQNNGASYYYQAIYGGFHHNEASGLSPPLFRSCKTVGNYRVVIRLTRRSGTFFPSLVISSFAMQSPTAMKKYGADQGEIRNGTFAATGSYAFSHPTGTGPFKFKSWKVGEKLELVKNTSYWGKKPNLDRIIIQPIGTTTGRLQALQSGAVNAYDLAAPQDVPAITGNSKLKVIHRPAFNVAYVTINQAHPPFDKLAVRQAVAYGLDRASVVRNFYYGTGKVAQEFVPPSLFGWTNKVPKYPYNPDKAKALLRSAGLTLPVKVDFWYPTSVSRPYMPDPKRNFEAFAASLDESGFKVVPHSAPWRPDYVQAVNSGNGGDLNLIGWTGDYGDPDNFVGTFFKAFSPQFGFHNPAIFNILTKAANEPNFKKRVKLYQQANIMIMKFLPAVPYAHATPALGAEKRISKLIATPVGGVWFQFTQVGGQ